MCWHKAYLFAYTDFQNYLKFEKKKIVKIYHAFRIIFQNDVPYLDCVQRQQVLFHIHQNDNYIYQDDIFDLASPCLLWVLFVVL